jgi:putative SOS response-associated peptidase YedK
MCGRFSATTPRSVIADALKIEELTGDPLPPSWNVAPTRTAYVATTSPHGSTRRLDTLRWGLVPSWAKDPRIGNRLINARAETLASTPAYRSAVRSRRAAVPVSGYYEWQKPPRDAPKERRAKVPYFIHPIEGELLVLAGLWEVWRDAEGQPMRTFAIVTTDANDETTSVHDRMPVILPLSALDEWLSPEPLSTERLGQLVTPAPPGVVQLTRVSPLVNDVRNDGPELVEPATA